MKEGVRERDLEVALMDGYYVRMANASQVDHIVFNYDCGGSFQGKFKLEPQNVTCNVNLDFKLEQGISQKTWVKVSMTQF